MGNYRPPEWSAIMSEDFEGPSVFEGWNVYDGNGSTNAEYYWDKDDFKPHAGSFSAWPAAGGTDALDPEYSNYPNNCTTWAIYGPFDLSDAEAAELNFFYWNQTESQTDCLYDYLFYGASLDGSIFYGTRVCRNSGGWQYESFDLSDVLSLGDLTGESQVWITLRFKSDSSVTYQGVFVDDIVLRKAVAPLDASSGVTQEIGWPAPPTTLHVDAEASASIGTEQGGPRQGPELLATP